MTTATTLACLAVALALGARLLPVMPASAAAALPGTIDPRAERAGWPDGTQA
jgi:hypothetical protein